MTRRIPAVFGSWFLALAVVLAGLGLLDPACGQTPGVVLLVQQTPAKAGTTFPSPGVHNFSQNEEVTLTAIPHPGYRFVYWLGDVSEPVATRTVAYLDKPKIVVAVFDRIEYETMEARSGVSATTTGASSARSGLIAGSSGISSGGGGISSSGTSGGSSNGTDAEDLPPPLPEPEPPIPEPATAVLLALGGLYALTRRRMA